MIRKFRNADLSQVLDIWLEGNLQAHSFITASYWKNNVGFVSSALPKACVYVYEEKGIVIAFVGLEENHIAGLFVKEEYRSRGIGHSLLDFIKHVYGSLTLCVYEKNLRALNFYKNEEFEVVDRKIDSAVEEAEYMMKWIR